MNLGDERGMDPLLLLQALDQQGLLGEQFYPYQQQQGVLNQRMDIANQMQQPGSQHSTPWGALLGGLSDAAGKGAGAYKQGQVLKDEQALGQRQQDSATNLIKAYIDAINKGNGAASVPGLSEAQLLR